MIKLPVIILGLLLLITGLTQKALAQEEDISLDTFYQELAPYGTWAQDPDYGYVWKPNVDMSTFRPYYTDGHWAMTEYGNTWVSDYEWGWAPFHYGRWILNRFNEWLWIPDTVWGPAWVSWRSGDGYYGWAPLGPGIDIDNNIDEGSYNIPNDWWVFIPQISIYSAGYPRYYSNRNAGFFNRTTYINYNYGRNRHNFFTGPRADDIRKVTHRNVTVYNVNRANRPGRTSISNNNTINIYNPGSGRRGNNNGRSGQNNGNNPANGQSGGRGNNNPAMGRPNGNNNPVVNGQNGRPGQNGNGQPGRNNPGRGNNSTPDRPAGNPPVNGQSAQPVTGTNPANGQNGQFGGRRNPGRGNNPTPGQPAGNTPVSGQNGQPGRGNNQGTRPPRTQQPANAQQQQQMQQQRDAQRQQQQQQNQQRQQQMQQQRQQQQQQQNQQRQQQMQQQRQQQQQQQNQQRQQQMQQRQQQQQQQNQQRQQQMQQQRQQQQQQRQQQMQQRPSAPARAGTPRAN